MLAELAKLLRSYHDATIGFTPSVASINQYPESSLHEVICHNDAALYNIVFKNQRPVGIIDFDMAVPGPRIWDIVYTLYTCVPLTAHSVSLLLPRIPILQRLDQTHMILGYTQCPALRMKD